MQDESVAVTAQAATASNRYFGAHCADTFELDWLDPCGWAVCNKFVAELDKEAIKEFYYDLKGKQYYWHTGGDQNNNSLEDVDLFFSDTHGGAWQAEYAEWGMWDYQVLAKSNAMKLGDEGRKLDIFATFSCHVNEWNNDDDNNNGITDTRDRWDPVFSGGLKTTLSSQDIVYADFSGAVGQEFAERLNAGYTLRYAWYYALRVTAADNDASAMFTGTSSSNCSTRRSNMSWDNYDSYGRITGTNNWLCVSEWWNI